MFGILTPQNLSIFLLNKLKDLDPHSQEIIIAFKRYAIKDRKCYSKYTQRAVTLKQGKFCIQ